MSEIREALTSEIMGELKELTEIVKQGNEQEQERALRRFIMGYNLRKPAQVTAVKEHIEEEMSKLMELDVISKTEDILKEDSFKYNYLRKELMEIQSICIDGLKRLKNTKTVMTVTTLAVVSVFILYKVVSLL